MTKDVNTEHVEKKDNYDGLCQYSPADITDPFEHAMHHTMCWKDRSRFDEDIEELRETIVEQTKEIENLTKKVNNLSKLLHDLFNGEALYHVGMNLDYE